jgi:hypothetical protein
VTGCAAEDPLRFEVRASGFARLGRGACSVPDNYKASGAPLIPWGATTAPNMPAGTNLSDFWHTNNAWVPLNNGTVQRMTFNDNVHPWRNQFFDAPNQGGLDASLLRS